MAGCPLRRNSIPLYTTFFIHSSTYRHLGYFCTLAIVNNAAVNTGVQIFLRDNYFIFFGYISRSGLLEHIVVLFLVSGGSFIRFFIEMVEFTFPPTGVQGYPFIHILACMCYLFIFFIVSILTDKVISHCGFDLQFSS